MSDKAVTQVEKESKAGAGMAGAGGGTLLVVIANNLPENSRLKPWLVFAAPTVSVTLGALWLWLRVKVANYVRDREVKSLIEKTRRELEQALKNSNTSPSHRARIRKELEGLELVVVDRNLERIKSLRVLTEEDISDQSK